MKALFTIPEPCHESWNAMDAKEQGRFCGKCAHVVMDFTNQSNAEIADFLKANAGHRVCGRVRNEQLLKKTVTPASPAKRYRVFFAALYFVFGGLLFTSCNNDDGVVGKLIPTHDTIPKVDTVKNVPQPEVIDSTKYLDSVKKSHVRVTKKPVCVPPDDEHPTMGIMEMPDNFESDTLK
jgi:hypothetical protein